MQPVATSGNSRVRMNRRNKPEPLPWVATGCVRRSMVRRGSTVRVRQRACLKALRMGILCCLPWRDLDSSRVRDGYILGLAGTRGHARRRATRRGTRSRHSIATTRAKSSCKQAIVVARAGATVTPSFAREGLIGQIRLPIGLAPFDCRSAHAVSNDVMRPRKYVNGPSSSSQRTSAVVGMRTASSTS